MVDTGSTDNTVKVATEAGFNVTEAGEKFLITITKKMADDINNKFIVDNEPNVISEGDKIFDFASARNYAASLATNDHVSFVDADEAFTVCNIPHIKTLIEQGFNQFEYDFVFAHAPDGSRLIQFVQSKFYNKKFLLWVGVVHEVLQPISQQSLIKKIKLKEDLFLLEHYQNQETNRDGYLKGLAYDCFDKPNNDRNSHYFARECLYKSRLKTAIKEFERHIAMNRWYAERAQSLIFIGDCYLYLGKPDLQAEYYFKAYHVDPNRREALIKLSQFYLLHKNYRAAVSYATASLTIPFDGYYANSKEHYEHIPHEILYKAYGWLGLIDDAQKHIIKALEYRPLDSGYLRDLHFYFKLPVVDIIIPTVNSRPEGLARCIESIYKLEYPKELVNIILEEGDETVPEKMKLGLEKSKGSYIAYMADDTEFTPYALILNVFESIKTGKGLVAFDTGVRNTEGFINEHFLINKSLVPLIGGEIFDTDFRHFCCDDWLHFLCDKLDTFMMGRGVVKHRHYSRIGSNIKKDKLNLKAETFILEDRETLKRKIADYNSKHNINKN